MLAEDRLNAIVSMVQRAGSVTVLELAEALGVTASTIGATCRRSTERTVSPRSTVGRRVLSART